MLYKNRSNTQDLKAVFTVKPSVSLIRIVEMVNDFYYRKLMILFVLFSCLDLSTIHGLKIKSSFCDDGRQIFYDKSCDGLVDCIDGSDETAEKCSKIQCPYYSFQCTYGPCINRNKICDGVKDCADNSDENGEFCVTTSSCGPMKFRCSSNECIDVFLICDGRKDCKDGSDEIEETCRTTYCSSSFFKCKYGACVAKTADCNGVEECADGSDEIKCSKD